MQAGEHSFMAHRPGRALAPFVESIWYFEGEFEHHTERIVPDGRMQILVNLAEDALRSYHGDDLGRVHRIAGAGLGGVFDASFGIDTQEQRSIVGVSFLAGGTRPFFDAPADALRNHHVELEALWGREGKWVRERLLAAPSTQARLQLMEAILLERVAGPLERDPVVDQGMAGLEAGASVRALVQASGLSVRTFQRRFLAHVGVTPKRYGRLRRFQRVLADLHPVHRNGCRDWAALAQTHGYCDQAHLIGDFRAFAGVPPGRYRPRAPGQTNHVAIQ